VSARTRSLPRSIAFSDPEVAVFVSGVASMGLEILAGRVLAPEFGSGIYTWGSIIGVFLAALSLGYALGGRRARERASSAALVRILVQAALFVAFLLLAADAVLQFTDALPVPARYASIVPVTVLFGPPTFLLGFISPYAAELSKRESAGSASGRVYAVGTVGSIVGAFATTFLLIPAFAVAHIELGFGLLLLLAAANSAGIDRSAWLRIGIAALALTGAFAGHATGVATPGETVHQTQTPYQELRVTDDGGVRTLYLNGAPQSATYLDDRSGYVFEYPRYFHVATLTSEDVDRVLFVGGGGFSGPERFLQEYPNVTVDVVELDPEVVSVAKRYFGVNESHPRLNVHVGDGREFLQNTNHTYDAIVLDAYRKDRVPFHLTTVEFMNLAESKLDDDGTLVANVISASSGSGSEFYRAEYRTMQQAFPHVYAFPTSDTPFLQNIELVATKNESGFTQTELQRRATERDIGIDLTRDLESYRNASMVLTDDVPVLRDDRAPVDQLLDPQFGRRYVVERNGSEGPDANEQRDPTIAAPA
jgi:spermidine synthase